MGEFSWRTRKDNLIRLGDGQFDLLIIGGGITGAYAALDASLRGLRVALVEKDDFASGTSSKSSKMVHGGLRYIEQGKGAPVTAVFGADGITVFDPYAGPAKIYDRPV